MKKTDQYRKTGTFHRRNSDECQDVVYYREKDDYSMIVLADGVSSCENGGIGARVACETVLDFYMDEAEHLERFPEEKMAALIAEQIRFRLEEEAGKDRNSLETYASTLAFVFYNKRSGNLTAFNLGDGGIFWTDRKECHSLLLPSRTNDIGTFTTMDDIAGKIKIERRKADGMDSVWICSDGVLNEMREWSLEKGLKGDMIRRNYMEAKERLDLLQAEDDCSFIAMKIR